MKGYPGVFSRAFDLAYLKIGQIRTIEVSDFSVVDNVSAILSMSPHGTSAVAFVIAPIDLLRRETKTCSQDWRWLEHVLSGCNRRES